MLKQTDSQDTLVSNHPFVLPPIPKPVRAPEAPKRQSRRDQGAQRRNEGRQYRFEREVHPQTIDDDMADLSPRRARGGTGPLAPLPRLVTTWQTHRVRVEPGTRHTRDSAHAYLAQRTGIARSAMRAIQVSPDSISVDVESREVERFKTALRDDLLG